MTLTDRLPPSLDDPDALVEAFGEWAFDEQGLSLYPAQEEALLELVTGSNVILATPTGSGKSLVAVAAHATAVAQGRRTFYTAPIKALVSEKFFALVYIFGAENVGMVTGDSSANADAPIICCTAEILANMAIRRRTGRPTAQVTGVERPVPLHYYYAMTPVQETAEELLHGAQAPVYIVHF